jgi:hypothetical protein
MVRRAMGLIVTCRDADVSGSIVVRPKRKLDRAWMVYSSLNDDPSEADASQVCEALLRYWWRLGRRGGMSFQRKMNEGNEVGFHLIVTGTPFFF